MSYVDSLLGSNVPPDEVVDAINALYRYEVRLIHQATARSAGQLNNATIMMKGHPQ